MKKCIRCNELKDESDYYKYRKTRNYSSRDGLFHRCKRCVYLDGKKYRESNKVSEVARTKKYFQAVKMDVYNRYGGAFCNCCGEKEISFLSIDHINGGGRKHRREEGISGGGYSLHRWLINNGYPDGFQVLCHNCNQAKHINGICPHKKVPV